MPSDEGLTIQVGTNKKAPEFVLLRREGCPGGMECRHRPQACPPEYDTYSWQSVIV